MKKLLVLFEFIIIALFGTMLINVNVYATNTNDFLLNVRNIKEVYCSRDGITWLEFDDEYVCAYVIDTPTPNGSNVEVFQTLDDISQNKINNYNSIYDTLFPDATRLSSATARYNCHSYAWYSQNTSSNVCWMNNPEYYYNDYSYDEVLEPRCGDIVCYFNIYGENIHSGIVLSYNSSIQSNNVCGNVNKVVVKSKWGPAGLYEHRGDQCPYTKSHPNYDYFSLDEKLEYFADEVKYYRPRTTATISLPTYQITNDPVNINGNGTIIQKYKMYELDVTSRYYEFSVSSNNQLDVRLYDDHMQLVNINQTTTGTYTNSFIKHLDSGIYYLRVAYIDTTQSGTIYTSIINHTHTYYYNNGNDICSGCGYTKVHQHSYNDHYQWKSTTEHKSYCLCNGYITDFHIVSPDAYQNGNQFAICLLCHGIASFGGIIHDGIGGFPYTLNGSFILPNGVIVLVDEDFEAYLNGTLIFINPNENIDRGNNHIPYIIRREDEYILD